MLEATKKQTKTFKSLSTFSDGLNDMSKSMEKFGDIATTLEKTLNPEVLGNVISKALLKDLNPVLADIKSITSNVDDNSQKITKFLEEDLKNDVIKPLLDSVKSTDNSMKEMKEVLEKTSEVMNETSLGIEKISDNLNKLEESQTKFVKNLDNVLDKQKDEFEKTTTIITDTYKKLTDDILKQTDGFEKNSKIILNSFTDLSKEMKSFLNNYKEDYKVILDEQRIAIKDTSDESIKLLGKSSTMIKEVGVEASILITDASTKLQSNLTDVNNTLILTGEKAVGILDKSGKDASNLITGASEKLGNANSL